MTSLFWLKHAYLCRGVDDRVKHFLKNDGLLGLSLRLAQSRGEYLLGGSADVYKVENTTRLVLIETVIPGSHVREAEDVSHRGETGWRT